jgi:hypothetical protein
MKGQTELKSTQCEAKRYAKCMQSLVQSGTAGQLNATNINKAELRKHIRHARNTLLEDTFRYPLKQQITIITIAVSSKRMTHSDTANKRKFNKQLFYKYL